MPVTVSLLELVSISGTKPAWPSEFRGFVETIESAPDDRTNYLVLADWLRDQGEEWLEKACRYFAKNTDLLMIKQYMIKRYSDFGWEMNLPMWLVNIEHGLWWPSDTPVGPLVNLAYKLRELAEELA